jgi:hypothetical protein
MSSEMQITLPTAVGNQINDFFRMKELNAFQELSDIFVKAVLQKSASTKVRAEKDELFTFSKIMQLLKLDKTHRAKHYKRVIRRAKRFGWSDEILEMDPGGNNSASEMWFTSYGFLQTFTSFPRNKHAVTVVNICFKIADWVMITNAEHQAMLLQRVDELEIENAELEEQHEDLELEIQHLTDNADVLEDEIQENADNFVACRKSPWKEYCQIKHISEDPDTWPRHLRSARWTPWHHCKGQNFIIQAPDTCNVYVSRDTRILARQYWSAQN